VGAWAALVLAGFVLLLGYGTTPTPAGVAPPAWPAGSALSRAGAGAWDLLLFAHPHCPCTKATLDVLAAVTAREPERLRARVVVVRERSAPAGWERGEVLARASRIPGVRVTVDADGAEARRFGAASSGHAFLYDPGGALRFSGGLTAMRGHAGESPGSRSVAALLRGQPALVPEAAVYGCPLFDPQEDAEGDEGEAACEECPEKEAR
jgi:hypothetical protein